MSGESIILPWDKCDQLKCNAESAVSRLCDCVTDLNKENEQLRQQVEEARELADLYRDRWYGHTGKKDAFPWEGEK